MFFFGKTSPECKDPLFGSLATALHTHSHVLMNLGWPDAPLDFLLDLFLKLGPPNVVHTITLRQSDGLWVRVQRVKDQRHKARKSAGISLAVRLNASLGCCVGFLLF